METNKGIFNMKRSEQDIAPLFVNEETAWHLRNLTQNANLTIITSNAHQATAQEPNENANKNILKREHETTDSTDNDVKNKENKCHNANIPVNPKRQKLEVRETQSSANLNPFAALPISLISNGTLSVTSDSACVEIENGVPILKEAKKLIINELPNKDAMSITIITPASKSEPNLQGHAFEEVPQTTDSLNNMEKKSIATKPLGNGTENFNYKNTNNHNEHFARATKQQQQQQQHGNFSLRKQILSVLTKQQPMATTLQRKDLIPNSNQMDFLTLLGLEIVVDSCCFTSRDEGKSLSPKECMQCGTNFTSSWQFDSINQRILCFRCDYQHKKTKGQVELTNHLQSQHNQLSRFYDSAKMDPFNLKANSSLSKKGPTDSESAKPNLYKNYLTTASAFTNCHHISDLIKLGALIATDPIVLEFSKKINTLDRTAKPELRVKAVQEFQIVLHKVLTRQIGQLTLKSQSLPLLHCRNIVSQMAKEAMKQTPSPSNNSRQNQADKSALDMLNDVMEAQLQNFIKTLVNQESYVK